MFWKESFEREVLKVRFWNWGFERTVLKAKLWTWGFESEILKVRFREWGFESEVLKAMFWKWSFESQDSGGTSWTLLWKRDVEIHKSKIENMFLTKFTLECSRWAFAFENVVWTRYSETRSISKTNSKSNSKTAGHTEESGTSKTQLWKQSLKQNKHLEQVGQEV